MQVNKSVVNDTFFLQPHNHSRETNKKCLSLTYYNIPNWPQAGLSAASLGFFFTFSAWHLSPVITVKMNLKICVQCVRSPLLAFYCIMLCQQFHTDT